MGKLTPWMNLEQLYLTTGIKPPLALDYPTYGGDLMQACAARVDRQCREEAADTLFLQPVV